jgi:hypothetical protein
MAIVHPHVISKVEVSEGRSMGFVASRANTYANDKSTECVSDRAR